MIARAFWCAVAVVAALAFIALCYAWLTLLTTRP